MQLSAQNIIVNDHPGAGEHLVYNTRTQALVKVESRLMDLLHHLGHPESFSLRMEYACELEQLYAMGFVVENGSKDEKELLRFLEDLKRQKIGDTFAVTILTTMACNFRCAYCFEEGVRQPAAMSAAICRASLDWIKARVLSMKYEKIFVTFYGGEPLLNEDALEYVATDLRDWCAVNGIGFKFMIQTNGYLITAACVQKYLPLGLSNVRISLDGVGDEHDRLRPLRTGGGTFDRIMGNIMDIVDLVQVGISVSYDKNRVAHIAHLLDYLESRGILGRLGRFIFSPIHASLGSLAYPGQIHGVQCQMNYSDQELLKAGFEINRLMAAKGLAVPRGLAVSACSLGREYGGFAIDPQGYLYACNSMLGYPQFAVGSVFLKEFNGNRQEFLNMDVGLKCPVDCRYLPVCNGGCRLMSFMEHGRFDRPYCKAGYLDQMAPELVKSEYDALTHAA
ncbi:MAG: radical SAM protein [Candidatus Omnitrophota bacterium]